MLRWSRLLLGSEPKQRLRASQSLLVLAIYVAFGVVKTFEVRLGMLQAPPAIALTAWNVAGGLLFYAVIRSGLNLRLRHDLGLSQPQSLFAMASICWAYAITGQARGGVLLILMLVVLFNQFVWTPRQAVQMTTLAFLMLAAVMGWKSATDPRYDPRVESIHLLLAGVALVASAAVAARTSRLRARLESQRRELAEALERIRLLATSDALTGLPNRRAMTERLHAALQAGGRRAQPVVVAMIDLDRFKRVNDDHGHAAGDAVLRHFAALARAEVRDSDALARWGGEEFLLLMQAASVEQCLQCLARIRDRLRAAPIDAVEPGLVVAFSAGVALCAGAADLEPALARADAAMYRAKQAGRDRALAA